MYLIFIGGQSASGKTGLSQHLLDKFNQASTPAQILNMDDYYQEIPEGMDLEKFRRETNFDTPDMLYFDLLSEHLSLLNKGKPITKPLFSFKTNKREGEEVINPSKIIIIEGIFAQYFYKNFLPSELNALSVNITTDNYLDIVARRIKRDNDERSRKREDVLAQEKKYVGPGFLKYTASSATGSDVYITNERQDTLEKRNLVLEKAADEVFLVANKKLEEIDEGAPQTKKVSPNVQKMVIQSHLEATKQFEGEFNGVFGTLSQEENNRADLIRDLRRYTDRIKKHKEDATCRTDFKHNFWFFKNSRAINREANYYLAEQLLRNLLEEPEMAIHEIFADILEQRSGIIAYKRINNRPDFVDRGINSVELNAIIDKAHKYDPAPSTPVSPNSSL